MADTKITDMTAATALARADLVAVVQDVATTPVNRSATLDVLDPGNVLGGDTTGGNDASVAINPGATVSANSAIGIGDLVEVGSSEGVGIGRLVKVPTGGLAIGSRAQANRNNSIAVGGRAVAGGSSISDGNLAVGYRAEVTGGARVTVLGTDATSGSTDALVVGNLAEVTEAGGTAIGKSATAGHTESVALGKDTTTTAADQVMVGPRDIEITGIVKGIVLVDRTLGTRHRVYLDNGVLSIEEA